MAIVWDRQAESRGARAPLRNLAPAVTGACVRVFTL